MMEKGNRLTIGCSPYSIHRANLEATLLGESFVELAAGINRFIPTRRSVSRIAAENTTCITQAKQEARQLPTTAWT